MRRARVSRFAAGVATAVVGGAIVATAGGCAAPSADTGPDGDIAADVSTTAGVPRDAGLGRDRGVLVHDWVIREPESERLAREVRIARARAAAARMVDDPAAQAAAEAEAQARESAADPLEGRVSDEDALDFPAQSPETASEPAEAEAPDPFAGLEDLVPTGPINGREIGSIIASLAVDVPAGARPDDDAMERLRRNGLRLLAVPRERFRQLQAGLGVPQRAVETWLGDAFAWRDLATRASGERAMAVAVGDAVTRFDPGVFRLQVRAWTIRMEDGPRCHVELRLEHADASRRTIDLLGPSVRPPGRLIDEINFEFATSDELLWVIASADPSEPWPEPGAAFTPRWLQTSAVASDAAADDADERPATAPETIARDDPADSRWSRPRGLTGPGAAFGPGPAAEAPRTTGRVLLEGAGDARSWRVLVIEPRIPASLDPAGSRSASGAGTAAAPPAEDWSP